MSNKKTALTDQSKEKAPFKSGRFDRVAETNLTSKPYKLPDVVQFRSERRYFVVAEGVAGPQVIIGVENGSAMLFTRLPVCFKTAVGGP